MYMKDSTAIRFRRRFFKYAVRPIMRTCIGLFPVSDNKVVFDNFGGKGYGGNPKYITEALLQSDNPKLDLVWLASPLLTEEERRSFPDSVRVVNNQSFRGMFELGTAKVRVENIRNYHPLAKRKGQIYLQTWHGSLGVKKVEKDAEELLEKEYVAQARYDGAITDAIIADNHLQEQIYERAFWLNPEAEILRFGFPQNDQTVNKMSPARAEQIKQGFGMDEQYYYVLYAPTFRDDYSTAGYQIDFERVIKAFETRTKKKTRVIVRLHPNVAFQKEKIRFSDSLLDGTDYPDIQDLALSCDAVISDYSSVLFDFAMLSKPAFICALDYEAYKETRGFIPEFYELPFPQARSTDGLIHAILNFDVDDYEAKVEAFYEKYPSYGDGYASEKTARWILKHLH